MEQNPSPSPSKAIGFPERIFASPPLEWLELKERLNLYHRQLDKLRLTFQERKELSHLYSLLLQSEKLLTENKEKIKEYELLKDF